VAARESLPGILRGISQDEPLAALVSQWLRFCGPVEIESVRRLFGIDPVRFGSVVRDLVEEELVIVDRLLEGREEELACDRENLEALLRMSRSRRRADFRALPADALPLFVASHQGLTRRGARVEDLKGVWERLFGYGLPARLWEEEVLPARMDGYRAAWVDSLFAEGGIAWLGCGRQRITFCFREDTPLYAARKVPAEKDRIFPASAGKFSFWDLLDHSGLTTAELSDALWRLAWAGAASNDAYQTVRQGIASGFRAVQAGERSRRPGRDRWQSSRPSGGYWFLLPEGSERDALEAEEENRDRIRQVLLRCGVVFREMLEAELPPLRWPSLFRSLRIMELSGEVLAGRFFDGVPGLQFALPQALEELSSPLAEEAVFWVCAADPASLCGLGIEGLKGALPARFPTTHVVFHGRTVVLVSRRQARELEFRVPPDDPRIPDYLAFLRVLSGRDVRPLTAIHVERINGEGASESLYSKALLAFGFTADFRRLTFRGTV
jgi:ATP-dependent Lhr-like helicase